MDFIANLFSKSFNGHYNHISSIKKFAKQFQFVSKVKDLLFIKLSKLSTTLTKKQSRTSRTQRFKWGNPK